MTEINSINTSMLSDTSDDDSITTDNSNDINVFEFNIDGDNKICGLNKPQDRPKLNNPVNKNKVLNKKEIEFMLKNIGKSANFARNTKIKDSCNILYNADKDTDASNNIKSKKKCSFIQNSSNKGIECLDKIDELSEDNKFLTNKMKNQNTTCSDLTHKQLVELAKIFNVQYKGKKNQICNNLVKYFNKNKNDTNTECYKNLKKNCNNDDNCNWLFESKDLLIQRLELLDLLSNNKNHKEGFCTSKSNKEKEYYKCSVEELLFKLRNKFNMKHLTSRCINKKSTEKSKIVINNHKLTIYRETLKYFYNDINNLNDILTNNEILILNEIIDKFNTDNNHTTLDEFTYYENNYDIFNKILQNENNLTNIIKNICNIEFITDSREIFLNKIFEILKTFNLSNLEKIKNTTCNSDNAKFNDTDSDEDSISTQSLSESLSETDEDTYSEIDDISTETISTEDISSEINTTEDEMPQESKTKEISIENTKQYNQFSFLQNNFVERLIL